jgi:integrase
MHARAFRTVADEAAKRNESAVRPFLLYDLRHTFLTRLGTSGCDAWTLARLAGHASIAMSARYVHASDQSTFNAIARLSGTEPQRLLQ